MYCFMGTVEHSTDTLIQFIFVAREVAFVLFYGYCGPEHRHTDTIFCDARSAFCIVLWVLWRNTPIKQYNTYN